MSASAQGPAGRLRRFLTDDVWDVDVSSLPRPARLGVSLLRVLQLVGRGFREDDCMLQAAALTLSTLMAIVPILALSLSVARGLGGGEAARAQVTELVANWTEKLAAAPAADTNAPAADAGGALAREINEMVNGAFDRVDHLNFAALGGVGLVLLVLLVIQMLAQVESSFNRVWGVSAGRSLLRKFTDYTAVLFTVPFLLIALSTLPAFDGPIQFLRDAGASPNALAGWLRYLASMAVISTVFTLFFVFMPNTKVRWGPGAIGGVLTGVLFVLWLWACAAMQVSVAGYSRLYGSFAVIPILLAWLFMSWQIVLFGAEVSFAMQNHATYRMESGARRASAEARVAMALAVVLDAARGFTQGGGPFESARFAREQGVSVRFLNEVVDELAQAGILAAVSGGDGGRYALLRAPDALPAREVAAVMLRTGATPASLGLTRLAPPVARLMAQFAGAVGGETVGDLLKDGAA